MRLEDYQEIKITGSEERLILLNKVSEEEIMRLLKEKEQKEAAQSEEREAYSHEEQEVII